MRKQEAVVIGSIHLKDIPDDIGGMIIDKQAELLKKRKTKLNKSAVVLLLLRDLLPAKR